MTSSRTLFSGLIILAAALESAAEPLPAEMQQALATEKQIYVATRRADGSQSAAAPIWFWWDGTHVYFTTSPDSHKGKRIRRGSPVLVSVKGADGPFVEGTPEIIDDLDLVARMGEEYNKKYWIAWMGFFRPRPDRVAEGKTIAVKVTFAEKQ
jgi:general stress protein 26